MSFLRSLFGFAVKKGSTAHQSTTGTETPEPVSVSVKEDVLRELKAYWDADPNKAEAIKSALAQKGPSYLRALMDTALDDSIDLNLRKVALACGARFGDDGFATFLSKNFVSGKDPKALDAEGRRGNSKAEAAFCLYRQAKESLEQIAKKPKQGGYELPSVPSDFCEARFGAEPPTPLSGPGTTDQKAAVEAKKRGDLKRYIELYLKALDLGIDEEYDVSTLHMGLGQAYVQLNRPKEAIQQFYTILTLKNRAPVAVWQAAMYMYYVYDELGRSAEARKLRQLAEHANKIVQLRHDSTLEREVRQLARERLRNS